MSSTHGEAIIRQTKKWFSSHGILEQLTSDNGPQWKDFAQNYGFRHTPISPLHSQSNGMVEKGVGIAKNMLIKCHETRSDPYIALMNIRNTLRR